MKTDTLKNLLEFYGALGRPLSVLELRRLLPERDADIGVLTKDLEELEKEGSVVRTEGFWKPARVATTALDRKRQDVQADVKWRKLLKRARWLRFVPFLECVFASGSMALGNASWSSDFDLLTVVRTGRLFTARYFLNALFFLLGARRMDDLERSGVDRLCFNHIVTATTLGKPPYNRYRHELYRNLVPLCGTTAVLEQFWRANAWCHPNPQAHLDQRFLVHPGPIARALESLLGGWFGSGVEALARTVALWRIGRYVARKDRRDRVVVTPEELEFHFRTDLERRFGELPHSLETLGG